MKNIFTLMMAFLLSIMLFGQTPNYVEVVYLKNGSKIKGVILENIFNDKIKIQTADGSEWVYRYAEIEKIEKEVVQTPTKPSTTSSNVLTREHAKTTIINLYQLPNYEIYNLDLNSQSYSSSGLNAYKELSSKGVLQCSFLGNSPYEVSCSLTVSGKRYSEGVPLQEQSMLQGGLDVYGIAKRVPVKMSLVAFQDIVGIVESKLEPTAEVEYTVLVKEVTPFNVSGLPFWNKDNVGDIIKKKVKFIKYDDGWRIKDAEKIATTVAPKEVPQERPKTEIDNSPKSSEKLTAIRGAYTYNPNCLGFEYVGKIVVIDASESGYLITETSIELVKVPAKYAEQLKKKIGKKAVVTSNIVYDEKNNNYIMTDVKKDDWFSIAALGRATIVLDGKNLIIHSYVPQKNGTNLECTDKAIKIE